MRALALLLLLGQEKAPDPAEIAAAGARTAQRLKGAGASWTVTHETPTGVSFKVEVLQSGGRRRLALSAEIAGQLTPLCRIIDRDGAWYVTEGGQAGKYRPYEAPLSLPTAYLYLTRSNVMLLADAGGLEGWRRQETRDGVSTYRAPVPEPVRKSLEKMVSEFESRAKTDPSVLNRPEVRQSLARSRDLLEHGLAMKVEAKTGIVVESGNTERRMILSDFRWREKVEEAEFSVADGRWTDFTSDPAQSDLGEWVMLGHNGYWRPGHPKGEFDVRLLDLKTGALRRVPYQGANALPGCFLKGRAKVAVSALTEEGALGLFEVDLKTGANRRLGGGLLETGYALFPALSPDGKSLALLHKAGTEGLLEVRVALADLESGEARYVSEPMDTAFLSWLPDGKGFVLIQREYPGLDKPAVATVCRMDLKGKVTPLVKGDSPFVLPDGRSILFQDQGLWKTCDLEGKNAKSLGDGLRGFNFPAPAPDGKRLLMIRFKPGQAPEPVILKLGATDGDPATKLPGLWGMPAWR